MNSLTAFSFNSPLISSITCLTNEEIEELFLLKLLKLTIEDESFSSDVSFLGNYIT